ncbi:MAG: hypothetical protein WA987_15240, partial [Cellvibrio sp.]
AQMWCEKTENKEEMAKICSGRKWINAPYNDIIERMKGTFDYGVLLYPLEAVEDFISSLDNL